MKVLKIEDPTELRKHSIWIVKDEDEDWRKLRDAVYHDRTFSPNRACVIVTQRGRDFWADWMQVREEYEGANWERCVGTQTLDVGYLPKWAREVEDFAVSAVKVANP